jgi:hypothetical protein
MGGSPAVFFFKAVFSLPFVSVKVKHQKPGYDQKYEADMAASMGPQRPKRLRQKTRYRCSTVFD